MTGRLSGLLAVLCLASGQADESLAPVSAAVEKTESGSYSYVVEGRFRRSGEFVPPGLLSARIGLFQSARHGDVILVKGPEGLWKSPSERLGERTEESPSEETVAILKTLQEAEPPMQVLRERLADAEKAAKPEDRDLDGTICRLYVVSFARDKLRASIEKQMETSIARGAMAKPDEVRWATTRGSLRIYVDKKDGVILRAVDERSVRIEYKGAGAPETKTYRLDMAFDLAGHGASTIDLPPEVRKRLGVE